MLGEVCREIKLPSNKTSCLICTAGNRDCSFKAVPAGGGQEAVAPQVSNIWEQSEFFGKQ